MKVKNYSLLMKGIIVFIGLTLSILKWLNVIPNASITEIWASCGSAYALLLGTVDFNIIRDNEAENKQALTEEK